MNYVGLSAHTPITNMELINRILYLPVAYIEGGQEGDRPLYLGFVRNFAHLSENLQDPSKRINRPKSITKKIIP